MTRTIRVKGIGSMNVKPDLVVISMNLEACNKDYGKAMDEAAKNIAYINESLGKAGFDKDSLKTTNFTVNTKYKNVKQADDTYQSVFDGYVVSHDIKVSFAFTSEQLSRALTAINTCVVHPRMDVEFTVQDTSKVSEDLLREATKNARQKAEILCSAAHEELGDLVSIDYDWSELDIRSNTNFEMQYRSSDAMMSNVEMNPDDIYVRDTVSFLWEIK